MQLVLVLYFFFKKSNTGQKNRHEKIIKKIASNPIIILKWLIGRFVNKIDKY